MKKRQRNDKERDAFQNDRDDAREESTERFVIERFDEEAFDEDAFDDENADGESFVSPKPVDEPTAFPFKPLPECNETFYYPDFENDDNPEDDDFDDNVDWDFEKLSDEEFREMVDSEPEREDDAELRAKAKKTAPIDDFDQLNADEDVFDTEDD